ncbi:MAG: LysR family transcriptional regulator [Candidatus Pseudomonas phytovorans]|uniref:LysR family transcriptional regulator n=1 Tax=Candidatus Pseudomonas phytovorans TaxID=3121377 RepID=A0AAJ5WPJ2_9PSED|nr:LysR family transcriptional regulator [Pseudomonas sp.]WEK33373.1 MAG: LysR family transcriptional regulator [Pseudomonas sp.]
MDLLTPMRTFLKVAETGSFSATANVLDMSPQLVGKHVQALEQHLGLKLLNRTTRKQSLTEFGEAFLDRARVILDEFEDAERLAESARGKPVGRLRVNAPVTFGNQILAPRLVKFMQAHPAVTVVLTLSNHLVDVVSDGYDVVFRVGDLADSSLIARRLGPYPLVLCAAPSYLATKPSIVHPEDLAKHECLGFTHSELRTHWTFRDTDGASLAVPITSKFMVNQSEPLLTACLAGMGLILQPLELVRTALRSGQLIEVLPDYPPVSPPISVLYSRDRRSTPKLTSFLAFCTAEFTEQVMTTR